MRADDTNRFAGLDQERFIVGELAQGCYECVESFPCPSCLAGAAVDYQVIGILSNFGIKIIHEHPQRRFLNPALASSLQTTRSTDEPGTGGNECGG